MREALTFRIVLNESFMETETLFFLESNCVKSIYFQSILVNFEVLKILKWPIYKIELRAVIIGSLGAKYVITNK